MPTFFVAGTPKGGTNMLLLALGAHPEVFVPWDLKEPMFFFWHGCDVTYRHHGPPPIEHAHHRNLDAYRDVFAPADGARAVGEGSVHYLASERAAANLHAMVPEARIVLMFRDPVDRAVSHHAFNHMRGVETRSFDDAIAAELDDDDPSTLYPTYRYVGNGRYGAHLACYRERFPAEQVLPLRFEDLTSDPGPVLRRAERFVGVTEGGSDLDAAFRNETVSGGKMMAATRYLRTADGRIGDLARGVERAAGGNRTYRTLKQKVKIASRRSSGTAPVRPEVSGTSRAELAALYRDDAAILAELTGLDLDLWSTAVP